MKVYKYWAEPMTASDHDLLHDQLRRAAWYRKDLDQIEDRSRVLRRAILSLPKEERTPYADRIRDAERRARKAVRDRARSPTTIRIEADPEPYERQMLPLAWGTSLKVEDAHDQSQRTTAFFDSVSGHISQNEGVLACQFQRHGEAWELHYKTVAKKRVVLRLASQEECSAKETELRADPANLADTIRVIHKPEFVAGRDAVQIGTEKIGRPTLRSGRTQGAKNLRELKFRIGSQGREPIWAKLYVMIETHHRGRRAQRPFPEARIAWAQLVCRRVGPRDRWMFMLVVDEECRGTPNHDRAGIVGVDLGWRKLPAGWIRVAYWVGSDGAEGELVIPPQVYGRAGKSDSLRAIRDRERDAITVQIVAWLGQHCADDHPVRQAVVHAHQWKRMMHYFKLRDLWQANRIAGDDAVFGSLLDMITHNRHLWSWEAHNRRRMLLQIDDRVQQFAVTLARRYQTVCVEGRGMVPDLIKKRGQTGEAAFQRSLNATRVALLGPGSVRASLEQSGAKYGATYREFDPAGTTRRCANCGEMRDFDDAAPLLLTCSSCGVTEDQDRTSARNLVRLGHAEALEPAISHSKKRKMGTRRTRRKGEIAPLETERASVG